MSSHWIDPDTDCNCVACLTTKHRLNRIAELERELAKAREIAARLAKAMRTSVDSGSTDHLDCHEDAGAYWHDALEAWDKLAAQEAQGGGR